ncbi:MAG: MltA domain-containing protein, partial [Pseudomonadota bacterium]
MAGQAPAITPLSFADLPGWAADDHGAALDVWRKSCGYAPSLCQAPAGPARAFWETHFTPVLIGDPEDAKFTGYYEPVIRASRERGGKWQTPLYAPPRDIKRRKPHFSRAEIDAGALAGQGLEIFWLEDPVAAYFLQIQGSGRLILPDGALVRVGYAGKNGHRYRSIGAIFNKRRKASPGTYKARSLRAWLTANPVEGAALMRENPSFVFFAERQDLAPQDGPIGAQGVPLTAGRSLAVDREVHRLGLPFWVETIVKRRPFQRLMIAQDTGSAINGPQRGDIFFGTGDGAGKTA